MFEGLKKRLKGVATYSQFADAAREIFYTFIKDDQLQRSFSCWRAAAKDPDEWFKTWFGMFDERLRRLAQADARSAQALSLRKETVEAVKGSITALTYFDEEFTDEDRKILGEILMPEEDAKTYGDIQYHIYAYNDISSSVLRMLSYKHFEDARANDWFDLYSDIYKQYIKHAYSSLIAEKKDSVYALQPLVPVLKQQIDEFEHRLYQGENWEYDKQQALNEVEEEEKEREKREEARKRPKQKTVSNHQIDELSEYLAERVGRISRGGLYTAPRDDKGNKFHPQNPERALWVDLGLMLIALSECVEDRKMAVDVLRKASEKSFKKIVKSSEDVTELDLSIPEAFLDAWEKHNQESPLAHIAMVTVELLYGDLSDIDNLKHAQPDDSEQSKEWSDTVKNLHRLGRDLMAQIAVSIMDDMLEVGHYTKKIFGWDVGEYVRKK
ncbi:MAG: hypothetical protein AABZ50_05215 [Pseudomonadota bacterium]